MHNLSDEIEGALLGSDESNILIAPPGYTLLPEGKYKVRLAEIDKDKRGLYENDIFVFHFDVIEGEYKDCAINAWLNKSRSAYRKNSKLVRFLCALEGKELDIFESVNLDELIGKKCIAVVTQTKGQRPTNKILELEAIRNER